MKKFLCYLLLASMLITSCVGCKKQTKETNKEETKVEKTDSEEEVPNDEKETEDEVVTKPAESTTKQETTQQNNSKHTHSYSKSITQPTCTAQGYTTYTCSCGNSYKSDYIAAKGHTEVIDPSVPATTTSTGLTEGKHCSVCSQILVAQKVTDKMHTHSYSKSVTQPTCTAQGYTTYTCSCGDSYKSDYIAAKGHTEVTDPYVPATTTSTGLTEGKHCSVCSEILVAQKVIDKIAVIVSGYDFGWTRATIDATGTLNTNGSPTLNNYLTPLMYFKSLQINLLSDNIMFKIAEYDEYGNFISVSAWQSKSQTNWTAGGTNSISVNDKYVRIAIADTVVNSSGAYTMDASDYDSRYSYQITGTAYRTDKKLSASQTITLPDIKYGEAGKGFTITGLTYSAKDNTYYAGNYGKVYTSDTTLNNTIVHLSSDLKTKLGEIELNNIYQDLQGVQGVTIDSSDDTIWFVSPNNYKMYHISKDGQDLGFVSVGSGTKKPTGIAYDSGTDTLWVLYTDGSLEKVSKEGNVMDTTDLDIPDSREVDQIYLDETDNSIYITAGTAYQGDNYVYKVNLSTKKCGLLYTLADSHAIEGIYIKDGKMYIGNDGVYHKAKIESNIIQVYDIK